MNFAWNPLFESTSTAPSISSWSLRFANSETKKVVCEDNESISSDEESDDEEFAGFAFSSQEAQSDKEVCMLECLN